MNDSRVKLWLADSLPREIETPLRRLARAEGVVRVAVLPDVHFAEGACVGTALATRELLYAQAVGGDIGCGMATVALTSSADTSIMDDAKVFDALYAAVPPRKQRAREALPPELDPGALSDPVLARRATAVSSSRRSGAAITSSTCKKTKPGNSGCSCT